MELNVLTLRHLPTLARIALRKMIGRAPRQAPDPQPGATEEIHPFIDVQALIRENSIEGLDAAAEDYFDRSRVGTSTSPSRSEASRTRPRS